MKIELSMNEEAATFIAKLKNQHNELVVPLDGWNAYISDNLRANDMPDYIVSGSYVITEREHFDALAKGIKGLYCQLRRLTKEEGGFWFVSILEPKKKWKIPICLLLELNSQGV